MVIGGEETREGGSKMVTGGAWNRESKHGNEGMEEKICCVGKGEG